ncbi:MAG TPA: YggS family pyridoxal phosphate-dependent enzyme [Mycobacteriales bacterium]|nr:YggS family pyridoxal phosphate-dependent enzyme [Mycobacteriales bacterium]
MNGADEPDVADLRREELRREELSGNLTRVHDRVRAACASAGRDPREVTLVAVSKTFPVADVLTLHALGQQEFGENRHQEAVGKATAVPAARWHFVGQLQRNKARAVASYADVVQSVDRLPLVPVLGAAARQRGRPLEVLVQVDLGSGESRRGGVAPTGLVELADAVAAQPGLLLTGVMAVAPRAAAPRAAFARLRELAERLRRDHPQARAISAGMSADLEPAVAEGATLLRVGTALFGGRSVPLG